MERISSPKLVVTSPPYPGIHVLYHRWQVDGRKETPAAFWIANRLDGAGSSYYTGDRKNPELRTYFRSLETNFRSIANVCGPETTLVQVVAFSQPEWQLPHYLQVMETCGFCELPWDFQNDSDGRLWRSEPKMARTTERSQPRITRGCLGSPKEGEIYTASSSPSTPSPSSSSPPNAVRASKKGASALHVRWMLSSTGICLSSSPKSRPVFLSFVYLRVEEKDQQEHWHKETGSELSHPPTAVDFERINL